MTHWLNRLNLIAQASTGSLKELATILGQDPAIFYKGQDLTGCDLRGQDLEDMDLTGCNIEKAIIDSSTRISPLYDPRVAILSDYIDVIISRDLNKLLMDFSEEVNYSYPAWALKALIENGIRTHRRKRWGYYMKIIEGNKYFTSIIEPLGRSSCVSRTMQIYDNQQRYISKDIGLGLEESRFSKVMFVGLLTRKIEFSSEKDYSSITPNSLIKRKRTGIVDV